MILYFVAALVLGLVVWIALGLWRIGRVSRGQRIGPRDGTALLLIDLQQVFWDDGPYDATDKDRVARAVAAEAARAKAEGQPVIAVRQEWSASATRLIARVALKGQALAGTPGTGIAAPFAGLADREMVKGVQDAFTGGELDRILEQAGVGRLRIAGLDGNYCVARTAEAALARGYAVELIGDGILAQDGKAYQTTTARLAALGAETGGSAAAH